MLWSITKWCDPTVDWVQSGECLCTQNLDKTKWDTTRSGDDLLVLWLVNKIAHPPMFIWSRATWSKLQTNLTDHEYLEHSHCIMSIVIYWPHLRQNSLNLQHLRIPVVSNTNTFNRDYHPGDKRYFSGQGKHVLTQIMSNAMLLLVQYLLSVSKKHRIDSNHPWKI